MNESSNVPAEPVWWIAAAKGSSTSIRIKARLWHEARAEACRQLGVDTDNVLVERENKCDK